MPSFPSPEFESEQLPIQAMSQFPSLLTSVMQHPSIITGKNHQGIFGLLGVIKRSEHLADDPVEFVNKISIGATITASPKPWMGRKGMMNVSRRQV